MQQVRERASLLAYVLRRAHAAQVVRPTARDGLLQEDGGFSSYGLCALSERRASPYGVRVTSRTLTYITLDRESVDDLLGVRASALLATSAHRSWLYWSACCAVHRMLTPSCMCCTQQQLHACLPHAQASWCGRRPCMSPA
jgi:hypothetical protein